MKEKLEYFLNAVHYCIYLEECWSQRIVNKFFKKLLSPIPKYLFTDSYREKYYKRLESQQKELDDYFFSKEAGQSIGLAHHLFGFFVTCYFVFIGFLLLGFLSKQFGVENVLGDGFVRMLIFAIPVTIGYIPVYKAVFSNDVYLKFFNEFEKKDEKWHRKWKRITAAFVTLSIMMFLSGVFITFIMLIPVFG